VTLADFRILEEVGSGSFGLVRLVEKNSFKYALKELSKNRVMELGKIESVFRERDFLKSVSHPAFPKIYQTFQDEDNLYFLMEHVPNGSLWSLIK
jgi:3-phosphoinositide dependent protein kinase-1